MAGEVDQAGQCRSGGGREQVPSACGECGRSVEGEGSGVVLGGTTRMVSRSVAMPSAVRASRNSSAAGPVLGQPGMTLSS